MTGNLFDHIADYYDVLHDDVDYPAECTVMERVFSRFLPSSPSSILGLGCGTGNHAFVLSEGGYRVTGIDSSAGMLRVARGKARGLRAPTFVRADMRRFNLGRSFDAAICMDGAFTHLLTERDILAHLSAVRRHLDAEGIYIFEFAQPLETETEGPGWIYHDPPDRIIWVYDLIIDPRRLLLTAKSRFFAFDGDRIRRTFTGTNSTRLTSIPLLRRLLRRAGMGLVGVFSTGEGAGLRSMRKDDPLPMAVAKVSAR